MFDHRSRLKDNVFHILLRSHPIDVVKTRLQVSGEGTRNYKALGIGGTVRVIAKEEGIAAFWKGIGAAWLREASYTSLRLGLYGPIKQALGIKKDSNFLMKFMAGSGAGAIGSIAGNPFDVLKTRLMAAEGNSPLSLSQAASTLYKQQGIGGFYRGLQANVMRAMVLNGTKMACYDQIKMIIKNSGMVPSGLPTQFMAAFGAGFFMATTVSPFDMVRTRLMNQPPDAKIYNGFVDCVVKIIAKDGPVGLYAGFIPIWARFAPTTTLQLVIFEQIKPIFGVEGSGE
ncbi:solute carrier family 25 protein [archaeon]|nr:MAG: solute carrier family 25 protein [archaeon]